MMNEPVIISMKYAEKITVAKDGLWIKNHDNDAVFLSWETIDAIADASDEHYFNQAIKDFKTIISQKVIN